MLEYFGIEFSIKPLTMRTAYFLLLGVLLISCQEEPTNRIVKGEWYYLGNYSYSSHLDSLRIFNHVDGPLTECHKWLFTEDKIHLFGIRNGPCDFIEQITIYEYHMPSEQNIIITRFGSEISLGIRFKGDTLIMGQFVTGDYINDYDMLIRP